MNIESIIETEVKKIVKEHYGTILSTVELTSTRTEFKGDITVVIFSMLRKLKGNPVQIGNDLGTKLKNSLVEVKDFNVIKGFLNLEIEDAHYIDAYNKIKDQPNYGFEKTQPEKGVIMVEFSSPNTNKPLHLGHIRNILLGDSVSAILKASGRKVYKTQIINDRGIHICKSMVAWKRYGNNETPQSSGIKGDKFVGNFYVKFNSVFKKEIQKLIAEGKTEDDAKLSAPILLEAQSMLQAWEQGDKEVVSLWEMMNGWVYKGFETTYSNMGVDFDCLYYESDTYLLGKEFIKEGLDKGVFIQKADGSIWCDLTDDGLDEKIVLRSDGTAVYMTQDIGTAIQRIKDYPDITGMVYTVGNEQDYHFKVLFLILKKLGFDWARNLHHLSYGMVDLPSGKMKSREGTVVDADDLMMEMTSTAKEISEDLGKLEGYSEQEKADLYKTIGLGALKYHILKVDPKKRILFDPKDSIDFQGNTGPFIQYTYARIQSIIRKSNTDISDISNSLLINNREREIIKKILEFPNTIQMAANEYSPALIANYIYELVKEFNSFYQNVPILATENVEEKAFRVGLTTVVGATIYNAFGLLGIKVPKRM